MEKNNFTIIDKVKTTLLDENHPALTGLERVKYNFNLTHGKGKRKKKNKKK